MTRAGFRLGREAQALLSLFPDDDWYDREKIITAYAQRIPPGQALRHLEKHRLSWLRRHGKEPQPRVKKADPAMLVMAGQRHITHSRINGLIRGSHLEQRQDADGRKWLRRMHPVLRFLVVRSHDGCRYGHDAKVYPTEVDLDALPTMSDEDLQNLADELSLFPVNNWGGRTGNPSALLLAETRKRVAAEQARRTS